MKKVVAPKPEGTPEGTQDGRSVPVSITSPDQQRELEHRETSGETPPGTRNKRSLLPPEMMNIMVPSLKVGAATGAAGLFTGAITGILTSSPPALTAAVAGGRWFVLGSSFSASRSVALKAFTRKGQTELGPSDALKASAVAGGCTGMVAGLFRGPKHIVPSMILFSLFGGAGQYIANKFERAPSSEPSKGFLHSKWSPVTFMTDEEYETILQEKLLRVEAEIAVIDDNIKELRDAEKVSKQQPNTPEQAPEFQTAASRAPSDKGS